MSKQSDSAPSVVFVSHQGSRTGAPLMLLSFLRWLRENTDVRFATIVVNGGPIVPAFGEVGPVLTMTNDENLSPREQLIRRVGWATDGLGPLPSDASRLERAIRTPVRGAVVRSLARRVAAAGPFDAAYLNSVHSHPALDIVPAGTPVVSHVHELGPQLDQIPPASLAALARRTSRWIAAAHCVQDILIERLAVQSADIDICHEFIPIQDREPVSAASAILRAELGLPADGLVVGAVGAVGWIKGSDLLVHVARRVVDMAGPDRRVDFIWMGAPGLSWTLREIEHDLRHAGLADRVRFIPARPDPRPVMELFDVLVLPSRSDTYPLVCLEAASLAKPIVCFDAGGMREFLLPEERLVVPYLDLDAMAARIAELLCDEQQRRELGHRLAARVRARHSVEAGAPVLFGHLDRFLAATRATRSAL